MSEDNPPIPLRAGPLTLAFDRGELRWIRLGDREVLHGVYAAVRTPEWATVPAVLEDLQVEAEDDRFVVSFRARHRQEPLWFEWEGRLTGSADGRVRFEMDGVARSTFLRNRIGLCVLHPVEECAGAACAVETADGTSTGEAFPRLVSPHQPFLGVRAMRHEVRPGVEAEVRFEGEVFETEDQRNWSDASFKTYSTPLALPLPVEVQEGERIRQSVTLTLRGPVGSPSKGAARGWLSDEVVEVAVEDDVVRPWPRLGLGLGASPIPPTTADRLRDLAPSHLRVDLEVSAGGWREALGRAAGVAHACGTGLEVAAFVTAERAAGELTELAEGARSTDAPVDAWLVFDAGTRTTTPRLVERARDALGAGAPAPPLGGGSDAFFAELNRERAAAADLELVSVSVNPQVHAFDDATMVENTTSLRWIAETIRGFSGDVPLALSPVTLLPRPATDPRQRTFFGAGWTMGLVAAAVAAGFTRLTLFEVQGPGGVMENGRLLPVGQILAELAALAGSSPDARVLRAEPDDRSRCLTLAVQAGRLRRVYVFNATRRPLDVIVTGLPSEAWRRDLRSGATAVAGASRVPEEATGQRLTAAEGRHALRVGGHGIVALDAEVAGS
ncbi:MAG: hypothetical protein LJF30_07720 [Acidobacteria bacterium]|jgi:hypothetical protein|nr:hypothetical protein [Acidobacteriota bacterium]